MKVISGQRRRLGPPPVPSPTDVNRLSGRKATLCKGVKNLALCDLNIPNSVELGLFELLFSYSSCFLLWKYIFFSDSVLTSLVLSVSVWFFVNGH